MRKEITFVIAEVVSVIPGALISALGDGRAQYGYALLLIGLPFYCLFLTLVFLPIFSFLEHRKSAKRKACTLITLGLVSASFAVTWSAQAGLISALAISASVGTAFLLTSWLTSNSTHAPIAQ